MPRFRNYQTNFSGGLLSEGMLGRLDLAQYENGCKQLDNWWPKVTGGMRRRPGSIALQQMTKAADTYKAGIRIESFIFNEEQTYLVVFGQVTTNSVSAFILNPDTGDLIDTVAIGGGVDDVMEWSIAQIGDVMLIARGMTTGPSYNGVNISLIRRIDATTFNLESFDYEGQPPLDAYPKKMPFIKFADPKVTLASSSYAKNSYTTLTASAPHFTSANIGRAVRYRGKQVYIQEIGPGTAPVTTAIGVILEELDRGAVLTFNTAVNEPEDFEVGEIIVGRDSGIKAEVIETSNSSISVSMIAGIWPASTSEEVEGLSSGNIAAITAVGYVSPLETPDWDEEAFSNLHGYPSVIEFHSQRLWFGGSSSLPAHVFGSRVAAFFNFDVGDAFAADSIQAAISGTQINKITNIVSGRHLQIFTDHAEFYAPQSEDLPLVPETFDLKKQTTYGSKPNLAKVFDESTLFVQSEGNAVREFLWRDSQRGYSSDAVSLICEEYIKDVQELEILYGGYDRPEQLAFFVNGDGTIMWYHSARAEQIRTWGRWTTQGKYLSVTALQDHLFALVERTIDGESEYIVERFELDVTVDCAEQDTSTATDTWVTAHGILLNEQVEVVTGVQAHDPDYYLGSFTLANGLLQLPVAVDNITVGLPFTQVLETMPIEVRDTQGVSGGLPKRLVSADLYMASTLAAEIEGNKVLTFDGVNDLTQKPEPITGVRKFYLLGYSERPTLTVENAIPVPFEALALGAEVEY